MKAATLRLKHAYPTADRPVVASVNIDHVLERVKHHELDVGTWLNVIGHVLRKEGSNVSVQAVAIWDAGNVDVQAYEKAMEIRKEAG